MESGWPGALCTFKDDSELLVLLPPAPGAEITILRHFVQPGDGKMGVEPIVTKAIPISSTPFKNYTVNSDSGASTAHVLTVAHSLGRMTEGKCRDGCSEAEIGHKCLGGGKKPRGSHLSHCLSNQNQAAWFRLACSLAHPHHQNVTNEYLR